MFSHMVKIQLRIGSQLTATSQHEGVVFRALLALWPSIHFNTAEDLTGLLTLRFSWNSHQRCFRCLHKDYWHQILWTSLKWPWEVLPLIQNSRSLNSKDVLKMIKLNMPPPVWDPTLKRLCSRLVKRLTFPLLWKLSIMLYHCQFLRHSCMFTASCRSSFIYTVLRFG